MNKGLKMVTGEIVGFLHSDDYYNHEGVVADVADAFKRYNVDSVYGDLLYVNKHNGRPVRYWKSCEYENGLLRWGWMPPHPTFFVLRKVYEQHGCFDTGFKISADYDLMLRFLGKQKVTTYYIPKVLVRMRLGGKSNKSLRNIVRKSWEDYKATKLNGLRSGFLVVIFKNLSKLQQFFVSRRSLGTQSTHHPETA
jgi:glycosyltransferase